MWLICLILSMACALAGVIAAIVIHNNRRNIKKNINVLSALFAGIGAASLVMFFGVHLGIAGTSFWGVLRAISLSLLNSIQLFAFGCEFGVAEQCVGICDKDLLPFYLLWASILYASAPILTFSAAMQLLMNWFAKLGWRGAFSREAYVFSHLNERSLTLARDIRKKHQKAAIVFMDVNKDDPDISPMMDDVKHMGAICFSTDILSANFGRHSAKKPLYFFAMGDDESENLDHALGLIERYKDNANTHLYIFSTKIDSELTLTAVDKGQMKVRRINEVRSLVNHWLYAEGTALFESARPLPNGEKSISAVVVGMGSHGTEMVKALTWYCQMDGYQVKINAFDKDPLAEDKFTAVAPELMHPDYNGVRVPGEAQYEITVHSGLDVQTASFAREIAKITDATYVVISLGSDELNLQTAVQLRMYFERIKIHPVIQAIMYNSQLKEALNGIQNHKKQLYDITFIGDLESSYTENMILNSQLEDRALEHHMQWGAEETFWTYEYNYRSSIATAIHQAARIFCGIPGAAKKGEELTIEERDVIEPLEHRRWNAYMRAEGYVYSGSEAEESRNDLGKMHNDLVNFSNLSEEERRKDSKVGTA